VLNLLSNALDFSPTGEPVIVRTERLNGHARISVTDRGPGIPAEFRARIFEKFGQIDARKKGRKVSTGLGLAFCKFAVEAHGGVIGVDSQPGAGSTFWLELPCESS
jgi:signal transduction histidine kinase